MSEREKQYRLKVACVGLFIVFAFASTVSSQQSGQQSAPAGALPGAADFEKRCYSCHNIGGGDKKGPDLRGVVERRSKAWLHEFIQTPQAMNRKGDPEAAALFKKYAPEVMPDQPLTPDQIDAILALISTYTQRGESFVPAAAKLSRPIETGDIAAGQALFTGNAALSNGGAACISCHNVTGTGRLGGGSLGPDLTAVNLKYRDPELISILQNPNFPTMKSVFGAKPLTDDEVVKLYAYFQNAKLVNPTAPVQTTGGASPTVNIWFPLFGFALTVLAFIVFDRIWRKRLRGVREAMVRRSRR